MNIEGLDYNTQRKKLVLPEYGREVQKMVDYAVSLPTKAERQACAQTIIDIMYQMFPQSRENEGYIRKLWDHLAIMSDFKLDIDYPYDVTAAKEISERPEPLPNHMANIPMRHYGKLIFELFEQLKTMPDGPARYELAQYTAMQMKRDLLQWNHGATDDDRVAADLEHFTDGAIQLSPEELRLDSINPKEFAAQKGNNKKKK